MYSTRSANIKKMAASYFQHSKNRTFCSDFECHSKSEPFHLGPLEYRKCSVFEPSMYNTFWQAQQRCTQRVGRICLPGFLECFIFRGFLPHVLHPFSSVQMRRINSENVFPNDFTKLRLNPAVVDRESELTSPN